MFPQSTSAQSLTAMNPFRAPSKGSQAGSSADVNESTWGLGVLSTPVCLISEGG